jgi:Ca-activated chloride channel family protein
VRLDLERAETGGPIPTLWARERIRELDDEQPQRGSRQRRAEADTRRRTLLVELGTRYGLLSSATSFVAVEERGEGDRTTGPAELRKIPVALTTGWGGGALSGGAPWARAAMPMMIAAAAPMSVSAQPVAAASTGAFADAGRSFLARAKQALFGSDAVERGGTSDSLEIMEPIAEGSPELPSDRVYDILMTQRADGAFVLSQELTQWLGDGWARVREAMQRHGEELVATAVVIALLARDEPQRESEWRPAVTKAQAWLRKQGGFDAASVLAP